MAKANQELEAESFIKIEEEDPFDSEASGGHDESNWLVSYADMMTLLCGFFIMLFSMAHLDEPKYEVFKKAISEKFGGPYVPAHQELHNYVSSLVNELDMGPSVSVKSDPSGVSVSFQSTVFFDTLSSEVTLQGRRILTKFIQNLGTHQKDSPYKIVVEGHTDGRPIFGGPYPTNWELSGARAARVVRLFLDGGFPASSLTAIGYADTHPEAPEKNADGSWNELALAKNRRVVIRILGPKIESIPFPTATSPAPAIPNVLALPKVLPSPTLQTSANLAH